MELRTESEVIIKQQVEWPQEDLNIIGMEHEDKDVVKEELPLQAIKTELEDSHDVAAIDSYALSDTYGCTKTELICEEEFLDEDTGPDTAQEYHQYVFGSAHSQLHRVSIAEEASQICDYCHNIYPKTQIVAHKSDLNSKIIYQCDLCTQAFKEKDDLAKHLVMDVKDSHPAIACDLCERGFCSNLGLKMHVKAHVKATYDCKKCGKSFFGNSSLTEHKIACFSKPKEALSRIPQHMKVNPRHKCEICRNVYADQHLLSAHQKEHTFNCGYCQETFIQKRMLRVHLTRAHKIIARTRLDELLEIFSSKETTPSQWIEQYRLDPLAPNILDKEFLENNTLVHTDGTMKFARRWRLANLREKALPLTSHEYKCQFCDVDFGNMESLLAHIKDRTTLLWTCAICGKEVTRRASCRQHIMTVHKKTDQQTVSKAMLPFCVLGFQRKHAVSRTETLRNTPKLRRKCWLEDAVDPTTLKVNSDEESKQDKRDVPKNSQENKVELTRSDIYKVTVSSRKHRYTHLKLRTKKVKSETEELLMP